MNPRSLSSLKTNRVNCDCLPDDDKRRIEAIGFWRWLDEAADRQLAQRKAGQVPRYSLEYRQKQMRRRSNRAKIAS
jgi:hypothetical protein